jgi:hypothetical protein
MRRHVRGHGGGFADDEMRRDSNRDADAPCPLAHDRIDQIVRLAQAQIPVSQVASGPANAMGLGPEYRFHSCLDFVLQDLKSFPGKGWRLVEAGLKSPVVRNRNMAVNVLQGRGATCLARYSPGGAGSSHDNRTRRCAAKTNIGAAQPLGLSEPECRSTLMMQSATFSKPKAPLSCPPRQLQCRN